MGREGFEGCAFVAATGFEGCVFVAEVGFFMLLLIGVAGLLFPVTKEVIKSVKSHCLMQLKCWTDPNRWA